MAGELMRVKLPCDTLAPVLTRRRLAALPALGWLLGDAMLVATELVTNAVRHSRCSSEDTLVVSLSLQDARARVSVWDPGRSGDSARIANGSDWNGGLGLRIVEQLTVRWGTERSENGYEVWAELPLSASTDGSSFDGQPDSLPDSYSYTGG